MILLDSNVLIALCEPRDELHHAAVGHLESLRRSPLVTLESVLCETCFALPYRHQRARLRDVLKTFEIGLRPTDFKAVAAVLSWLEDYAEHEPDWTDACIAVWSDMDRKLKVWTYDQEFITLWRRPSGARIPMAVKSPA